MKLINIFVVTLFIFLNSCQSAQDALSGRKKTNSDEFLVKKKNPLVIPPKFETLPVPSSEKIDEDASENSLKEILDKSSDEDNSTGSGETSIEKSILKTINNN